jgi:hypothetical protein
MEFDSFGATPCLGRDFSVSRQSVTTRLLGPGFRLAYGAATAAIPRA